MWSCYRNTSYVNYGVGILILYLYSNLKFIKYFNRDHLIFIFICTSTVIGRWEWHYIRFYRKKGKNDRLGIFLLKFMEQVSEPWVHESKPTHHTTCFPLIGTLQYIIASKSISHICIYFFSMKTFCKKKANMFHSLKGKTQIYWMSC